MKYKVGDKVNSPEYGKGAIIHVDAGVDPVYLVEYESFNSDLHMGFPPFIGKFSQCWWCNETEISQMLEPISEVTQ